MLASIDLDAMLHMMTDVWLELCAHIRLSQRVPVVVGLVAAMIVVPGQQCKRAKAHNLQSGSFIASTNNIATIP